MNSKIRLEDSSMGPGPGLLYMPGLMQLDQLKASLTNIEGVTLLTPLCAEQSASLVSFSVEGYTGEQLAEILLKQWNMIVKPLPHTREGLRVSVPFFSLDTEIDLLIEAIRNLASCQPTDLPDLK